MRWRIRAMVPLAILLVAVSGTAGCGFPHGLVQNALATTQNTSGPLEVVGHLGGPALAVAAQGNYAYVGHSFEFAVIDISNPESPQRIAYLILSTNDLEVRERYAYAVGRDGLSVIDVSEARRPRLHAHLALPGVVTAISLFEGTAYALAQGGLYAVDVRNPAHPQVVGFVALAGRLEDIAATQSYVYVTGSNGLQVVDVSQHAAPEQVAALSAVGYGEGLLAHNDSLFIASGQTGLTIVDISTPTMPEIASVTDTPGYAEAVALAGDALYVAEGATGVGILDMNRPGEAISTPPAHYSTYVLDLLAHGDLLLSVDRYRGLAIARRHADGRLEPISQVMTPGFISRIRVDDGLAYAISIPDGNVLVLDAGNPRRPEQIAFLETPGTAMDVDISSKHVVIADGYGGFTVADPATLQPETGDEHAFVFGDIHDVAVLEPYAILAGPEGLQVVEISDPRRPQYITCFCAHGPVEQLVLDGHLAYALDGEAGIRIIDMSNPAEPQPLAWLRTAGTPEDLVVRGRYAYVADGSAGLTILDVEEPGNAKIVASLPMRGDAWAIASDDDYAYVLERDFGLRIVDVSDPLAPQDRGLVSDLDMGTDVAVDGHQVFLADRAGGLTVLQRLPSPRSPSVMAR